MRSIAVGVAILLVPVLLAAASGEVRESFDATVAKAPIPVAVDGRRQLVYEIHLTNFSGSDLSIEALQIIDAGTHATIREFRGAELARRFSIVGSKPGADVALTSGQRGVVFVEFDVRDGEVPAALDHRIEYSESGRDEKLAVDGPHVVVDRAEPPSLGPPLKGGPWVAVYSPGWPRGHRRVFYAVDGRARLPGRFAIDWVKVDAGGHINKRDADIPRNTLGYGAEVIAVADATVADVRDGIAESASVAGNGHHAIGDAAGNYIVLDLGGHRYAFYEHLRPGSVRVKAGDVVRRGQVIGALGFTGDSTGPHLHFHVADGPSPLAAEGIPFVFDRFEAIGLYSDIAKLGSEPWQPLPRDTRSMRSHERPVSNEVVNF